MILPPSPLPIIHQRRRFSTVTLAIAVFACSWLLPSFAAIPVPPRTPCNCASEEKELQVRAALKKDQKLWGERSTQVASRLLQLADIYARRGETGRSDDYALQAFKMNECLPPQKRSKLQSAILVALARNGITDHDFSRAEKFGRDAVAAAKTRPSMEKSIASATLGLALAQQEKNQEALSAFEAAVAARRKADSNFSQEESILLLQQLAALYQQSGQATKSLALLQEAVRRMAAAKGQRHPMTLFCREMLASAQVTARDYPEAEKLFAKILADKEQIYGEQSQMLIGILLQYASVLELTHKEREATTVRARAAALSKRAVVK